MAGTDKKNLINDEYLCDWQIIFILITCTGTLD